MTECQTERLLPMLRSLAVSLIMVLGLVASASAETFLKHAPDVPLLDGFSEATAIGSTFDKPEGRIVDTFLTGVMPASEALELYSKTLPQLGWTLLDDAVDPESDVRSLYFSREREQLKISVSAETPEITVLHIEIGPLASE
jgi:hypothetical protein